MLGEIDLIRRRETPGSYVNGRWVPGQPVDTCIRGSLQPAGGEDLLSLEEGRRIYTTLKLYTRAGLRISDRIVLGQDVYDVVTLMGYGAGPLPHTKALVQAVT